MAEALPEVLLGPAVAAGAGEAVQLVRGELGRLDDTDPGLDVLAQEAALPGPGLHHERERRERPGAAVDLGAAQIVREDQLGDLGGRVALLLVDLVEQVEGVGEHVPRAAGRVHHRQLLGPLDPQEVLLAGRLDVVLHPPAQGRLRADRAQWPGVRTPSARPGPTRGG